MWLWLRKWATEGRFCWFQLASGRPLCSSARAGREGRGELARDGHQNNKRAAGVIIPPNAPCLPRVCSGSLASGQIECTHAKGYLGAQVFLSGSGRAAQAALGPMHVRSEQQQRQRRRFFLPLIQQSSSRRVACGHPLCNMPSVLSGQQPLADWGALLDDTAGMSQG
ncbi:hypothetical protein VZT92_000272 [Zoarces viviparus]|uniref:Uncharacterized protein n=1 Tax=Zoarces viviparus TaxID=48416 RepID=A0AAW1G5I3_ZOAVI